MCATRFPMKMLRMILVLAAMAGSLCSQDVRAQAMRSQAAHSSFVVHRFVARGDRATSPFWTPVTSLLVALDGVAKAADSFATRRNIDGGGAEYNPMARPFVHTTGVQVAATAALVGAEIATAYVLHRRHHDRLGRIVLVGGAVMNGLGAASSYKHRVAGW